MVLVWVFNQNVIRTAFTPFKRQPPLLVNPDVPRAVVLFQLIARRHTHESNGGGIVQLGELTHRHILDVCEACALARGEQHLGISVSERLNCHN